MNGNKVITRAVVVQLQPAYGILIQDWAGKERPKKCRGHQPTEAVCAKVGHYSVCIFSLHFEIRPKLHFPRLIIQSSLCPSTANRNNTESSIVLSKAILRLNLKPLCLSVTRHSFTSRVSLVRAGATRPVGVLKQLNTPKLFSPSLFNTYFHTSISPLKSLIFFSPITAPYPELPVWSSTPKFNNCT